MSPVVWMTENMKKLPPAVFLSTGQTTLQFSYRLDCNWNDMDKSISHEIHWYFFFLHIIIKAINGLAIK